MPIIARKDIGDIHSEIVTYHHLVKYLPVGSLLGRIISAVAFLTAGTMLAYWTAIETSVLPLVLLSGVLIFLLGSVTRFVACGWIAILAYGFFLGGMDVVGFSTNWAYPFTVFGQIIFLLTFLLSIKVYKVNVGWPIDTLAVVMATVGGLLLTNRQVFKSGHAIAALFPNEDNAAWILTLHRATSDSPNNGGDFGPLFDLLLYFSHSFIQFVFPNGTSSDNFANSVVGLHLGVLLFVPFISAAITIHLKKEKALFSSSLSEFLILALGLQVTWIHFITSGHASTGLSSILMAILLVLLSINNSSPSMSHYRSVLLWVMLAFAASSIWFPISPLAISMLIFVGIQQMRKQKWGILSLNLVVVVAGIVLIVTRELIPRFNTFRSEDSSLLSGAFNLLKMEGGVGSTGPYSFAWILLFLLFLTVLLPMTEDSRTVIQMQTPIIIGFFTVVGLKIINLRSSNGAVNYGARKYESVLILIALVLFGFIIVRYLSSRISSSGILTLTIGIGIALFSQLPAVEQFLSGRTYYGSKDEQLLQLGRTIANNLSIGDDLVCISEPAEFDRYLTYGCSRWTSAYSDRDNLIKNEWRKAVLGQIPLDVMPSIRDDLGPSTKLIVLGGAVDISQRNLEWNYLVDQKWQLIFARDN